MLGVLLFLVPAAYADLIGPSPVFLAGSLIAGIILLVGVNFLINSGIVHIAAHIFRGHVKVQDISKRSVFFLTLLGLGADALVMFLLPVPLSQTVRALTSGALIFLIAGLLSYFLVFRKIMGDKEAWGSAALFGFISNPVWLMLVGLF